MKPGWIIGLPLAFATLAACAPLPRELPVYTVREPFNPRDFAWSMNQGTASIEGRALLRGSDGKPRTCAGHVVALTADNAYSREGADAAKTGRYSRIERDPRYFDYRRTTICDAQGRFTFRHLPHGRWGIGTRVEWVEAASGGRKVVRGGPLGKRFTLKAGEKARIVFSERDL